MAVPIGWGASSPSGLIFPRARCNRCGSACIPPRANPGEYTGQLRFEADGLPATTLDIVLTVGGQPLADGGDGELWRYSRLRWLDSTAGIDDEVAAPYKPVAVKGQTVTVLGRELRLADTGLPAGIASTFSEAVDKADGPPREILARPMQLAVETAEGVVAWQGGEPRMIEQQSGSVTWESLSSGGPFRWYRAKMDCDGYINYEIGIKALREAGVRDVRLEIPLRREMAKYMMGLGFKGGFRPAEWHWKWNIALANHRVWIGDVNAGLNCKLKGDQDTWELYNLKATGLPESWSNGGQGGGEVREESADVVLIRFFTGPRQIRPAQELRFRFGLMATPVKTLKPRIGTGVIGMNTRPWRRWPAAARTSSTFTRATS